MQQHNDNTPGAPGDLVDEALERLARSSADLAAWRAGSPEHEAAAQEAEALWRDLGATRAAAEHRRTASRTKSRSWRRPAAVAAAVVLSLALGRWAMPPPADYAAPAGGREEAVLPDGSRATLNAGAEVLVDFTDAARRVEIRTGEALFAVTPDPSRPFTVTAGGVSARAVGTVYAVRRLDGGAAVTVAEGVVEVAAGGAPPVRLTAGHRAVAVPGDGPVTVATVDADTETAWRRGKLIVHGRPLAAVAAEMERYLSGRVVVAGEALGRMPVTGVFDLRQPAGMPQALAEGLGLKTVHLPWLTVIY
ncbi:transmembrane sensor [Azospirillum fermentarium]|uniref:FecR family protein n=1 Tax=Azospirillum fermentarium TaxID=1233114 RepID=UPI002225FCCF|nr:FecR domain-containing protein [Azospirillum fermentarium]MCW2249066.1 transmembrane sensor [Azospirillum fermentarium]